MRKTSVSAFLVCLATTGGAQQTSPQEARLARIREANRAGQEARLAGDWKTSRDHSRTLDSLLGGYANARLAIARASVRIGDTAAAARAIDDVVRMGVFSDLAADSILRGLAPRFHDRFAANRRRIGTPTRVGAAPLADFLAEGVAWDAKGRRFLMSSIKHGTVMQAGSDGQFRPFVDLVRDGGWAALGLAVDTARSRLWVTTNWYPHGSAFSPIDSGRSAVHLYDLGTGALVRRFELPRGAHEPGDICLSQRGDLFVSDGREGTVRIIRERADSLEMFIGVGSFFSPQGCAVDDVHGRLFVADYTAGIVAVDIDTRAVSAVAKPVLSALSGIDGLTLYGNCLVAVQNGTNPNRILGLRLDRDRSRIASVMVLAQDTLAISNPTHVTVAGSEVAFVENSGFVNYDAAGRLRFGLREEPSRIARIKGC